MQTPGGVYRELTACLTVRKKSGQLLFEFPCVGHLQGAPLPNHVRGPLSEVFLVRTQHGGVAGGDRFGGILPSLG